MSIANVDMGELARLEECFRSADATFKKLGKTEDSVAQLICASLDLAIPIQEVSPQRADELYNIVLSVLSKNEEYDEFTFSALARAHFGLGVLQSEQTVDPDLLVLGEAMEHLMTATDVYLQMGDQESMSNSLLALGPLHARLGDFEEAFRALSHAYGIRATLFGESHPLTMVVRHEMMMVEEMGQSEEQLSAQKTDMGNLRGSGIDLSKTQTLSKSSSRSSLSSTSSSLSGRSPLSLTTPLSLNNRTSFNLASFAPSPPQAPKPSFDCRSPRRKRGRLVPLDLS